MPLLELILSVVMWHVVGLAHQPIWKHSRNSVNTVSHYNVYKKIRLDMIIIIIVNTTLAMTKHNSQRQRRHQYLSTIVFHTGDTLAAACGSWYLVTTSPLFSRVTRFTLRSWWEFGCQFDCGWCGFFARNSRSFGSDSSTW